MKTPLALLLALAAIAAPPARAASTSLRGWTAWQAFEPGPGLLVPSSKAYTAGVVYCDMGGLANIAPFTAPVGRSFPCVIIGSAPKEPAKVGGKFGWGQATYPPLILKTGGVLTLVYKEVPYRDRTLLLTAAIAPGQEPYTSYVDQGYHRGAAAPKIPAAGPDRRRGGGAAVRHWWCDPKTGIAQRRSGTPDGWKKMATKTTPPCMKAAPGSMPAVVAAPLPLEESEMRWLTKNQQKDFETKFTAVPAGAAHEAGIKAVAAEYRALVSAQIRPEAKAAYQTAYAATAGASAKINAALGPVKMWGGSVSAPVALSGENVEIQLSAADYALLQNIPEALSAYNTARGGSDGNGVGAPALDPLAFDPIELHVATEAARKALPANRSTTTAGDNAGPTAPSLPLLTDAQKKMLTPVELANYESILKSSNGNAADRSLQELLKTLTARTEARKGSPYPAGGLTEKSFDAAPDWQKDLLCGPKALGASVAAGTTTGAAEVNNTADARKGLDATAAAQTAATRQAATPPAAVRPPWADKKCKNYPFFKEPVVTAGPVDANLAINQKVGGEKKPGDDKEVAAKEKSKWITRDLIVSGAKGAIAGLLIGSLFGPLGLFLGPLIGAAIFYGVSKLTS